METPQLVDICGYGLIKDSLSLIRINFNSFKRYNKNKAALGLVKVHIIKLI